MERSSLEGCTFGAGAHVGGCRVNSISTLRIETVIIDYFVGKMYVFQGVLA